MLARAPVEQNVTLTIVQRLRDGQSWSDAAPVFAWYEDGDGVRGAACMTPPYEMLLAEVPAETSDELVEALRGEGVALPGVNGQLPDVERFAGAWLAGTDLRPRIAFEQRLYALVILEPPDPPPPGRARVAAGEDVDLAAGWMRAFQAEAGVPATDVEIAARTGIGDRRIWLWEDEDATVVALAGRTATAIGVSRVAPVYTPPQARRRGYGAAITAACSADALQRDADHVVLFTDLANPTSNSIYQRIGFRPVADRRVVRFERP